MSYLNKIEYMITPEDSFAVIHNCAGCGYKNRFINTGRFRVNANGNRLDVWLIYQCEKCKHTLNLSIYERVDKRKIPSEEYQLFLKNDEALADEYGRNAGFFKKNRVEVDWENIPYSIQRMCSQTRECGEQFTLENPDTPGRTIIVHNPHDIKIRQEKIVSAVLGISRSAVKKMMDERQLIIYLEGTDLRLLFSYQE